MNPKMRRSISLLAAGSAFVLISACGSGGSSPAASTAPTAQGPVGEPTSPVTISFASWVGQEKGMKALYQKFHAAHPNITVEFQDVPAEEIEQKLTTQIAGGNPPDAAYVDAGTVATFASRDALTNLDPYIARSTIVDAKDYAPAFKAFTQVDGGMHGLPFDGESTALFYRKDRFADAGITAPPKTWDEFQADAAKLTDPANKKYGFEVFAPESDYYWYPWLWQNGGKLVSDDEKSVGFDTPEARQAAEFYVNLTKYSPKDYLNSNSYDGRVAFANGQVGMYMAGAWFAGTLQDEYPKIDDKWAAAPLPQGAAGCATTIAGDALVVFGKSAKQDAAWKWIEFLSDKENMAEWTYKSTGTLLPPRLSLIDSPDLVKEKPVLATFADQMKCGVNYNIANKAWPKVTDELKKQLGNAMYGDQTADQAIDNTVAAGNRLLARGR
ncbi:MAG TPA: sugar ABC transporter substrate-binding protein [Friedmanniella sp.]